MSKDPASVRQNLKNVLACHSHKGNDFFEGNVSSPHKTRWAKRFTARAGRRLNRSLARAEALQGRLERGQTL